MKKLIITDIDGTIQDNGKISEATYQTVDELQAAGHYYTLATGRHFLAVRKMAKEFNIDIPVICGNGTHVINLNDSTVIHEKVIPEHNVKNIHQILQKHDAKYVLYCTEFIMGTKDILQVLIGELRASMSTKVVTPEELRTQTEKVLKILIIDNDEQKRNKIRQEIVALDNMHIAASNKAFLDATVAGSDKGVAIQVLADYLGVDMKDVIAFGDQENDLQMLQTAGTGVAMGNAIPLIKEHIKIHTDSVSNDGFSKYIKENL